MNIYEKSLQIFFCFSVSIATPCINDNDLPILPQMIYFNLRTLARCDNRSIAYILRCMPNLIHFYFHLTIRKASWPFPGELLDGYVWQQMLEPYVPCSSKFEFNMSIVKRRPKLDLDIIVNSFETRSTATTNNHHVFYSNITSLRIYLIMKIRPTIPWSSPLFQQVNYLIVQMPKIPSSFWNNLLNMGKKNKSF